MGTNQTLYFQADQGHCQRFNRAGMLPEQFIDRLRPHCEGCHDLLLFLGQVFLDHDTREIKPGLRAETHFDKHINRILDQRRPVTNQLMATP